MGKIILFSVFFACSFCLPVSAETQADAPVRWEFAGWEGGGCYPNLVVDASVPDRIYATSDVAGIWRSDDRGESWSFITEGLGNLNVAVFAAAPSQPDVLYAGTRDGAYVSADAGKKWRPCGAVPGGLHFRRPENYKSIAVSAADPAKVIIGTASGQVFFSQDSGATWAVLGRTERPFKKKAAITALYWRESTDDVFAGSEEGIVRFSFKDSGWHALKDAPKPVTDFYFSEKRNGVVYAAGGKELAVSRDGGETWARAVAIPVPGNIYRLTAAETDNSVRIWAACNQGWSGDVIFSEDEGASWQQIRSGNFPDTVSNPTRLWAGSKGRIAALKADPFHADVLFRTDWWGIWRSDDGGKTWREKIKGVPNTVGSDVGLAPGGDIYAATMDDGLLKSEDGGRSYRTVFPSRGYDAGVNGHVWRIAVLDDQRIRATSSPWNQKVNQLVLSDDAGRTFRTSRDGLPAKRPVKNTIWDEGYARALALHPQHPERLYLGIDGDDGGGLYISDDTGWHWKYSPGQPGSKRIYNALAVDPTEPKRIFWGTEGPDSGVYVSEDEGKTWRYALRGINVFDIAVAADGTVYAGGTQKGACLYRSTDHGKSWSLAKRFSDKGAVEALRPVSSPKTFLILSVVFWNDIAGGRIYATEDGGKTWPDITGTLPNGTGAAAMAWDSKTDTLYEIPYAGSVHKAHFSPDESVDTRA